MAIVKYLFELCEKDADNKGKYLQVLFEFLQSKFPAVQFELANHLAAHTNNWNVLSNSVAQLIKILQESSDSNVKLVIVQKLLFFKKIGVKLI